MSVYSRCKVLSSYLTLALEIKLSNRYIYLFFSMLHSASTFLSKRSFRSFLFAFSSSITRTSVNYVQKDDGFLASVQTCVVNFLLWLLLELSSFLVWLHWCSVFVFAYIIYSQTLIVVVVGQVHFLFCIRRQTLSWQCMALDT